MRKTLSLVLYMLLVELVAIYLVVFPAYAFQVSSSTTGYVRTVNAAGAAPMFAANRAANISTIASAAAGGTSLAIRMVTGLGWVGLGVSAGLLLYDIYYSSSELAAVKAAATQPASFTLPGLTSTANTTYSQPCPAALGSGCTGRDAVLEWINPNPNLSGGCVGTGTGSPTGAGWTGWFNHPTAHNQSCINYHTAGNPASLPIVTPATTGTAADISAVLQAMPAANPLSLESNTTPQGVDGSTTPADQVVSQSVPASQVTTQVVPASQVGPTDVVVNKDATAPAGPVPTQTSTQTSTTTNTTTTTTITNPDGSTTSISTTTETEEAPVSACSIGNHEPRTFGGTLQDHMDRWSGSGLLSALNLLKTLTWPTTLPTYSLQSTLLGTFTLDFSAWSSMLTAIGSILIAIAGFVAYRIIFVGAR